jgi:hypothetical protein
MQPQLTTDVGFLRIGLQGIPSVTMGLFDEIRVVDKRVLTEDK